MTDSASSERRVLLFAYHFPPENVVGAARPYRFYKYLPRHGYKCHVITAAEVSRQPDLDAECVPDPFFGEKSRGLGWQMERSVRKLLLPGAVGSQWAMHAYRAGKRFLSQHPKERVTIMSTFPPLGTHLAAWWLAKRERLPWIADLRDPLAGNPATADLGRHTEASYALLERTFINSAAGFIANTDEAERVLKTKYPARASNIHLIWNGFDPEQRVQALSVSAAQPRLLSHVGELYAGRTVTPLLESLARLIDTGRRSPESFQVQLVGPVEASCLPSSSFINAAESRGWLKIVRTQVPKSEAQHIAQTSHSLLIVQPQSAIQVPGKLFEYLQIGRPILAFVPRDSSVQRVLEPSGIPFQCIYPDSSRDTFDGTLLKFLEIDTTPSKPSAWFEETFNAESQTATLARLLDGLAGR